MSMTLSELTAQAESILVEVERAVVGKREALELVLLGILADGHVLLDTRESEGLGAGPAFWSPPLGRHTLENVGAAEIRVIAVELKHT